MRFIRQLIFFALGLIGFDICGRVYLNPLIKTEYRLAKGESKRLPLNQETGFLQSALDTLDSDPKAIDLVFLGSSPTYGVSIKEEHNTYPNRFVQALKQAHPDSPVQIHNLAAKGFLASDLYAILQASLPETDAFLIQLNYHTFSPKLLKETAIRHPDLPERLGVVVNPKQARVLGVRPTPSLNWNARIRAFLRQYWWFYAHREALALQFLGDTPENWVYHRFYTEKPQDEESVATQAFYELKPARQTYMVQRYAQNAQFTIESTNIELFFLTEMLSSLKQQHKAAVFFIAPINADALSFYDVMDWNLYRKNISVIRQAIQSAGFELIDINQTQPLSEEHFADISHTLDSGGQTFGPLLWKLSRPYLESQLKL